MQIPPSATPRAADVMDSWHDIQGFLNHGETSFSPSESPRRASGRRTPRSASGRSHRRRGQGSVLDDSVVGEWSVDSIAEQDESGGDGDGGDDGRRMERGSSSASVRYRSTSSTRSGHRINIDPKDQQSSRTKHIRSDTQQTVRPFFPRQSLSEERQEVLVDSPGEENGGDLGEAVDQRQKTVKEVSTRMSRRVQRLYW